MIFRFEGFRNALFFGKLLYQPRKQCFCLLVEVCKVIVQLADGQQVGIAYTVMLLEIAEVPLSPYSDWLIFLRLIISDNQVTVCSSVMYFSVIKSSTL